MRRSWDLHKAKAVAVSLFIIFVAEAKPVEAQDDKTSEESPYDAGARSHFQVGANLYDEGEFEAAAREFEEAHRLSGRPQLLYNVYLANRDAGQPEKALEALQRYLASGVEIQNREQLEAKLQALKRQVERERAASSPPPPAQPITSPGDDNPQTTESTAEEEKKGAVEEPPTETPERDAYEEPVSDEDQSESDSIILPIALIAGGGALIVGGVVTGVLALGAQSDLESLCPDHECHAGLDESKPKDAADRSQTFATVTDLLFIGGAVVTGVGVTLLVFNIAEIEPEPGTPVAAATCGLSGCAANVTWEF